ncbi:hypothetical protein BBJ28_00001798 [Nothophytophthora sp. Chile5]|nr:hypothetical protein BBJ28_00001798 [Nothophytophthora sp. Chile5]
MAARRELRHEGDAFLARLNGLSVSERQRLSMEHREFLAGERDTDADFGEDAPGAETTAVDVTPPINGLELAGPSPYHPTGKTKAYYEELNRRNAEIAAKEAKEAADANKITRSQQLRSKAEAAEKKKAAEDAAVARVKAVAAKKVTARDNECVRMVEAAIQEAAEKKTEAAKKKRKQKAAVGKRKQTGSAAEKKLKTTPHEPSTASGEEEDDADDESESNIRGGQSPPLASAPAVRGLVMQTGQDVNIGVDPELLSADDHVAMNSEMDGSGSESEEWYVERANDEQEVDPSPESSEDAERIEEEEEEEEDE